MKKTLLLSLLGGVILFVWGFVSWGILPWHMSAGNQFSDEAAVSESLRANAPRDGVYYLPFSEEDHGPDQLGAFVNVKLSTDMNMGAMMGLGFVIQVLSAFIVLCLFRLTKELNGARTVGFFSLAGLAVGFISHAPYWNWFGFSTVYTLVAVIDPVIGWTLAGLGLSKFLRAKS